MVYTFKQFYKTVTFKNIGKLKKKILIETLERYTPLLLLWMPIFYSNCETPIDFFILFYGQKCIWIILPYAPYQKG